MWASTLSHVSQGPPPSPPAGTAGRGPQVLAAMGTEQVGPALTHPACAGRRRHSVIGAESLDQAADMCARRALMQWCAVPEGFSSHQKPLQV